MGLRMELYRAEEDVGVGENSDVSLLAHPQKMQVASFAVRRVNVARDVQTIK